MDYGKKLTIYLIDNDPTSRIKCKYQNWTGVVYRIPRTKLEECKSSGGEIVEHLKQSGVYMLLGEDTTTGTPVVYVGQASIRANGQGILERLLEHKRNKNEKYWNDWNEAIVITTVSNSLESTDICFLEYHYTLLAKNAGRYEVKNDQTPSEGNPQEETRGELFDFIDISKKVLFVLGVKVLEPIINLSQTNSPTFNYAGKLSATATITNEGFVLLKGSKINPTLNSSVPNSTLSARNLNATKISTDFITTEDILFTSPSSAACFVGGCALNGNKMWKTSNNKSPKDFNL